MNKPFIAMILAILLVISSQVAYAHSPDFSVKTSADILKFCEFYYEEYLLLGPDKLVQQHEQFPNLRACEILYNHVAWKSTHPLRNKVLIAEIEKYLGDSNSVKERHLQGFNTIPSWIKLDAKKWAYKEMTDAKFAPAVRSIIENNLVKIEAVNQNPDMICSNRFCFVESDVLDYSVTNNFGDIKNIKITVNDISQNSIIVSLKEITKEKINSQSVTINENTQFQEISNESNCCSLFRFLHQIPLSLGPIPDNPEHVIIGDTKYPFKGMTRDAWIVKDSTGNYLETIDKKTGIVISISLQEKGIITKWNKISLSDTNVFDRKAVITPSELKIPDWWRTATMWYLDGLISEGEYLSSLDYLFENKMLIV